MTPVTLEVCVDTLAGLQTCVDSGVDRVELCAALGLGGLTPAFGLMQAAAACAMPVVAMIRPRAGDFSYQADEVAMMCDDIRAAARLGLAGVVIGAATPDGALDTAAIRLMVEAAGPMPCTLHRVIDLCRDPVAVVIEAVDLGLTRILTSGGARTAAQGVGTLAAMHQAAAGRIEIMAGSGIDAQNVSLFGPTGIRAFHASCASDLPQGDAVTRMGFGSPTRRQTDPALIRALQTALSRI